VINLKLRLPIVLLLIGIFPFTTASADTLTIDEVANELICQCGCSMVLSECNHAICESREEMKLSIGDQIDQGNSKEQIIQSFVDLYGEQVLSSPSRRGFNLIVWIVPFVLLFIGGALIYFRLRKWVARGKRTTEAQDGEYDTEYGQRVDQELEEFLKGGKD
jgi:cytochrome c-type biogenesis protein CcmH